MEHFAKRRGSYLLLRSEQLVGAALVVIVKEDMAKSIRSVEATTKKVCLHVSADHHILTARPVFRV
jgi:hypothetical protein